MQRCVDVVTCHRVTICIAKSYNNINYLLTGSLLYQSSNILELTMLASVLARPFMRGFPPWTVPIPPWIRGYDKLTLRST